MKQGDVVKGHCNTCAGERNHRILHLYQTDWSEEIVDDSRIYGADLYELLQCAGCDSVTFRHTSTHSEITNDEGRAMPTIAYYPPATFRRLPKWVHAVVINDDKFPSIIWLPEFVTRLMREIYTALHGDCLSFAAMGIRALLETTMIQRVGDQGSFKKNLRDFQDKGHISSDQRKILEATLELGHASIHRNYAPSRYAVMLALDITENILEMLFVSYKQAEALNRMVPPSQKGKHTQQTQGGT